MTAPLKLKVRQVGGSLGVVLPREALAALRVGKGDELFFIDDHHGARLTAYDPELEQQLEAVERIGRRHRDVFRMLSGSGKPK